MKKDLEGVSNVEHFLIQVCWEQLFKTKQECQNKTRLKGQSKKGQKKNKELLQKTMAIAMNEDLTKVKKKKKSHMNRHECKSRSNLSRIINNSAFSSQIKTN